MKSDRTLRDYVWSVLTYANMVARGTTVTRGSRRMTKLRCCVRSCFTRCVWSKIRGSRSSLETTGLKRSNVRSFHYVASSHNLIVDAWLPTVEIKRLRLKGGDAWPASVDRALDQVHSVDLTGASGHPELCPVKGYNGSIFLGAIKPSIGQPWAGS